MARSGFASTLELLVMVAQLGQILESKREEIASLRGGILPSPPKIRHCDLKRHSGQPLRILAEIEI